MPLTDGDCTVLPEEGFRHTLSVGAGGGKHSERVICRKANRGDARVDIVLPGPNPLYFKRLSPRRNASSGLASIVPLPKRNRFLRERSAVEPTLAVIGLNFRTSPVAVRERFWISEARRYDALHQLVRSEGVEEVLIVTTCNRTEFILWASDVPTAANSVLRFLTQEYQIKLCEWSHFYRLMDDVALTHVFRVASGLDSMVLGEPEITGQVKQAWELAQEAGTTGRFLDAVMQKALTVSKRARTETAIGSSGVSVPYACVELSRNILGELAGREVLLIGAGKMSELAAHYLTKAGASHVKVMNRTFAHAEELAQKMGATPVSFDDRLHHLKTTDIVVSPTAFAHFILRRGAAEEIARQRRHVPLVMIDIAVPRDIEPGVRDVEGIHLFDMDDLEHVVKRNAVGRQAAAEIGSASC